MVSPGVLHCCNARVVTVHGHRVRVSVVLARCYFVNSPDGDRFVATYMNSGVFIFDVRSAGVSDPLGWVRAGESAWCT